MSTDLTIARIQEGFELLHDWEQRYQFIIDLGAKLPSMEASAKRDDNRVHGCMSLVWISARADADTATIALQGDSETATIKGIVAILIALYSGRRAAEIAEIDADAVFAQLGLFDHLSPTRHVGVYAMVEHIKRIAAAAGDGLDTAVRAPGAAGGHPTVLRSA